ncbi:PepSY domain-containing protein [Neorhizobium alkalisoli]|uniref:Sulfite reductase (NADPH) flavoprotein alpha-component n=1 Tax=Neorhizobium alkalisoli TaxID=528178 RepID=A0A561R8W0_9HYPH|nr:sulfite reductase flavoprotein subunit alpha [Neorhizobium alkalisoli]TWF59040.1 sulfite reductase (NADPH) flavoprotein alpha-component [Neorhizobium alkalisoli]
MSDHVEDHPATAMGARSGRIWRASRPWRISPRRVIFRLHWLLGISLGLVLAFMGMTGAMMGFEDEIMEALSPQARVAVSADAPLSADALLAIVRARLPQDRITALQVESDPTRAYTITVLRRPADGGRNPRIFVNPYSGELLGEATGADFFGRVRSLHRYLTASGASNDIGRHITGAAAFAVVFFAMSGLYLRWPSRPLDWRSWFRLDFTLRGRALFRSLHSVIGSWLAMFYVISALSGLWWSYDWYRGAVTWILSSESETAKPRKPRPASAEAPDTEAKKPEPVSLEAALAVVRSQYSDRLANVIFTVPQPGKPVRARVLTTSAPNDRALDDLQIDPKAGKIVKSTLHADLKAGEWIMANMDPIHTGIAFGPVWRVMVVIAALGLPFFAVTGILLYADRRRKAKSVAATLPGRTTVMGAAGPLIVYASQTGSAEQLARRAVEDFRAAGIDARLASIDEIDIEQLGRERQVLFIASTYGDGHAPDSARRFESRVMAAATRFPDLEYGVLALGDRRHGDFCAFGRRLDAWLHRSGAKRLFDRIDVDAHDQGALSSWQGHIRALGAVIGADETMRQDFQRFRLIERSHLNTGSIGLPVFRVRLRSEGDLATWQAGDIAEIVPAADHSENAPIREYSIASIAEDGSLDLVVRQVRGPDGRLGLCSGWLTEGLAIGGTSLLRIRRNANFHAPALDRPMILIGNGTGIAGLHAHLRYRAVRGSAENWLFFGERNRAADILLEDDLQKLLASGALARITTAFSRDQQERIYVQHRLHEEAGELCRWVDRGAAIYVCGSSDTMAPAVDAALHAVLGEDRMAALAAQGLYRRDIY